MVGVYRMLPPGTEPRVSASGPPAATTSRPLADARGSVRAGSGNTEKKPGWRHYLHVEGSTGTYFITFACYGTRLPGQAGAVDRQHNLYKGPFAKKSEVREIYAEELTRQAPYILDDTRRRLVLGAIQEVCQWRKWMLLAAHVRTNHVHVVVDADRSPEQVMNAFKSYSSRALNRSGLDGPNRTRWARHGSTRYLWYSEQIGAAIGYLISGQGEPMAMFEAPPPGSSAQNRER